MPYRIKGTLKLPSGQPAVGVDIEFISRRNYSPLVTDLSSIIKTTSTGAYDVTLEFGEYAVVVYWGCNQPSHIGKLFVFSDTAAGLDLQTLLQQSDWQPATPEYIQQIQDWLAQAGASASQAVNSAQTAKSEANRSKSEADRAKAEADKASQAVIDSAVPFPDVWIPFNDSLRMLAGYGREVKVGSDVVAQMVNFERSTTATYIDKSGVLRTAAINEPRFEKQGLLIEGRSTNLWAVQSGSLNIANAPLESVILPTGVAGNAYKVTPNPTDFSYVRYFFAPQTGQLTMSCFAKRADGSNEMPNIYAGHGGALFVKASGIYLGAGWWRMHIAMTNPSGNTGFGFPPTAIDAIPVHICFFQLEELPFASSYIPTNGTAVTRSADVCYIQTSGNVNPIEHGSTFALQFDTASDGTFVSADTGGFGAFNRFGGKLRYTFRNGVATNFKEQSGNVVCVRAVGRTALCLDGKIAQNADTLTDRGDLPQRIWFGRFPDGSQPIITGHIRNFRIWHRALSDAQIKGLA